MLIRIVKPPLGTGGDNPRYIVSVRARSEIKNSKNCYKNLNITLKIQKK
jgi:hypothetical protein